MGEVVHMDYQVLEVPGAHWDIPYARLEDVTPTVSNPAAVTSLVVGTQLTGTILSIHAADNMAVIDFSCGSIYWHQVRNVRTYAAAAEATWGVVNIGDTIFYDGSGTMPAGVYLSTSPLDVAAAANPVYGHAVGQDDADVALFPKSGAAASTTYMAVMQRGAGV